MAQTETALLTVEEFEKIPDPPGGHYVLHHGELVFVPPPILRHALVGRQLWRILDRICAGWYVDKEFAFRPSPEYEVWEADVAMVPQQRLRSAELGGWLSGSPDLVADVLSPSNTAQEINDKRRTCFQGGCQEFWVLDPNLKTIEVSTPDGRSRMYAVDDEIPLDRFAPAKVAVADVFAD
jgi:Uma2 family endonuclease